MTKQAGGKFKKAYAWGPCVLIIGVLGILFNLTTTPGQFPTVSLYLAAIGSIASIVIPQNF